VTARLANYAGFYVGWLACVKGAAMGAPWLGVLVAAALLAAHLRLHGDPAREARALALIGLLGLIVESALGAAGLYRFASGWEAAPWLAPAWIVALWLLLAATFESSLAWCASRPWLAALLGLVGGPLSFAAGEAMGAARLLAPRPAGLLLVGVVWAAAFPAACALARAGRSVR
jgi:hypothetical protein